MKTATTMLIACLAFGFAAQASAQSISPAWDAYRKQARERAEHQPAVRQGDAGADENPAPPTGTTASASADRATVVPPSAAPEPQAAPIVRTTSASARTRETPRNHGGAFIGAQLGEAEVYESITQHVYGLSAGYRWRAGSVTAVGIEVAAGKLDKNEKNGFPAPANTFYSLGATARFNFGRNSPLYAIARLGYWTSNADVPDYYYYYDYSSRRYRSAYEIERERVYGAYAGLGLGVDLGRHVSLSVMYNGYLYSEDYSTYSDSGSVDVNYADTATFGVEVRF